MENFTKTEKLKSMEKETNITLISTSVSIISFFLLLYAQNLLKTNAIRAMSFLTVIEIIYAVSAIAVAVVAIAKKKSWLWEYAIFGIIMAIGITSCIMVCPVSPLSTKKAEPPSPFRHWLKSFQK